jgi:hypothetical protein
MARRTRIKREKGEGERGAGRMEKKRGRRGRALSSDTHTARRQKAYQRKAILQMRNKIRAY